MKKLLFILFLWQTAYGQTTSLSFTPLANNDYFGWGRGMCEWNGVSWNGTNAVQIPNGTSHGQEYYYRFLWTDFENVTQGTYSWTKFDQQANYAIDNNETFSFGIMSLQSGVSAPGWVGTGNMSYPRYLHTLMQAETNKDWLNADNNWVPNWNSTNYLSRTEALLSAIATHIATTSHSGILYSKIIYYIDIRHYGDFGEWHNCCYLNATPPAALATSASLIRIVDAYKTYFPRFPLVAIENAFDHGNATSGVIPLDVSYYIITTTNAWGPIGWRRDNWGQASEDARLSNNPYSYNGLNFNTAILNTYKVAPVVGEPSNNSGQVTSGGTLYGDYTREIALYHATEIGNGNYPSNDATNAALKTNVIAASRQLGYNLQLTGGSMTTTFQPSGQFTLSLIYANSGVAPTYMGWKTYIVAKQAGVTKWTGTSTFDPKPLLPGTSLTQTDVFTFGALPTGSYDFYVRIDDTAGYKTPLALMITGRGADGSYPIRLGVTVTNSNVAPTAQANGPGTVQLPTTSCTLDGTQSTAQPGGSITTYAWTQLSGGPNTATIVSPSGSTTSVTGLVAGTYNFKLVVTDNNSLTNADTVTVVVVAVSTTDLTVFTTQQPPTAIHNDGLALTMGMKFRSSIDAYVTGVKFYKVIGNNGTHQGMIYDGSGNQLAIVTFSNESASGWQSATFSQPVLITANTTYMIAYFSPGGFYIYTTAGLATAITNNTLTALADGTDGFNGMYEYGISPAFPTSHSTVGGGKVNYWVDVIVAANQGSSCGPNCLPGRRYSTIQN